ncbi:uncharacterized protein isoform X3 [Rhodnius prolixus]|uniref:uncharacterized protein isoform X3 n=1 Tax=Rhodnius prolixus TaxID=13249 RepID=UPI003D18FABD
MSDHFLIENPIAKHKQSSVSHSNLLTLNQYQTSAANRFLQSHNLNDSDEKSASTSQENQLPTVSNKHLLTNQDQSKIHDHILPKISQIKSPLITFRLNNHLSSNGQVTKENSGALVSCVLPISVTNSDKNDKFTTISGKISSNSSLIEQPELISVESESTEVTFYNESESDNSKLLESVKVEPMIGDIEAMMLKRNMDLESNDNALGIKEEELFPRRASIELVEDYSSFAKNAVKSDHSDEESVADVAEEREQLIEMKADDNFYDLELRDPLQTEETYVIEKDVNEFLQRDNLNDSLLDIEEPLITQQDPLATDLTESDPLQTEESIMRVTSTADNSFKFPQKRKEPILIHNEEEESFNTQFVRVKGTYPPLYRRVICNYVAQPGSPKQDKTYPEIDAEQTEDKACYIRLKNPGPPLYRKVTYKTSNNLMKRKRTESLQLKNLSFIPTVMKAVSTAIPVPCTCRQSKIPKVSAVNAISKFSTRIRRINGKTGTGFLHNPAAVNAVTTSPIPLAGTSGITGTGYLHNPAAVNAVTTSPVPLVGASDITGTGLRHNPAAVNAVTTPPIPLAGTSGITGTGFLHNPAAVNAVTTPPIPLAGTSGISGTGFLQNPAGSGDCRVVLLRVQQDSIPPVFTGTLTKKCDATSSNIKAVRRVIPKAITPIRSTDLQVRHQYVKISDDPPLYQKVFLADRG